MTNKQKYLQIKKDIDYIEEKYGKLDDFCGGWCNNDQFIKLLNNPTFKTAYEILLSMLQQYWIHGYDNMSYNKILPINSDKRLQEIQERYL